MSLRSPEQGWGSRIAASLGILAVFAFGLWLRMSGLNWSIREQGSSFHPDERHVLNCTQTLFFKDIEPQKPDESYINYLKRYWNEQLLVGIDKGFPQKAAPLRPINFNYGTLPFFIYRAAATQLVQQPRGPDETRTIVPLTTSRSIRLGIIFFTFGLGIYQAFRILRRVPASKSPDGDCMTSCHHADPVSFAAALVYLALPVIAALIFFGIPTTVVESDRMSMNHVGGLLLVGRLITAWAGAASIYILFRMGRAAYGAGTGLLGAAMLATAVLHVQLSHFATVDIITSFFVLCALSQYLEIARNPRPMPYILGGIFTGFAIASKWSAVTLPGVMLAAHACGTWGDRRNGAIGRRLNSIAILIVGVILLHFFKAASSTDPLFHITLASFRDFYFYDHRIVFAFGVLLFIVVSVFGLMLQCWWDGVRECRPAIKHFFTPWLWFVVFIPVTALTFFLGEPFAFTEPDEFARDLVVQYNMLVSGTSPVVYTQQYRGTMPIFYLLDNLFYPSLDWLTAAVALTGVVYAIRKALTIGKREDIVLLAWILPTFLIYATAYAKFPRYMALILPPLLLLGARLLTAMTRIDAVTYRPELAHYPQGLIRLVRPAGWTLAAACLLASTAYSYCYVRDVYLKPHTFTEFREWKTTHYPGKKFVGQTWDEWGGDTAIDFHAEPDDNPVKLDRQLKNWIDHNGYEQIGLEEADCIALVSKRAYGTTFRWPERFYNTNTLFRLLFAEQLGFRIVKVFDRVIQVGPFQLYADDEDESFKVYDHPKIVVWENIDRLTGDQMKELILHPPDWIQNVTHNQILSMRDGKTIFSPDPRHPILAWLLVTEWLGLVALLLMFRWSPALPDRGFAFAKMVGMTLFSWLSWFLASVHFFHVSQVQLVFCCVVLSVLALTAMVGQWTALRVFLKEKWPLLLLMELFFLAVFSWFLYIRMMNPAIYWGEKPMDMSILSAMFRAETFPTDDPWISGRPLQSYYYYGYALFALPARLAGCPPNYFFNIAVSAIPAFMALSVFGLVYALTQSTKAGLLGSFLAVFSGHLIAFIRITYSLGREFGTFEATPFQWDLLYNHFYEALRITIRMVLWILGPAAPVENAQQLFAFDQFYFWPVGHDIVFGTNANEFPLWSFLFADMHAHMMVMPLAATFLGCAYAWYRHACDAPTQTIGMWLWITILSILLGSVATTNTWNMPGLILFVLVLTAAIFFERHWKRNHQTQPGWISLDGLRRILSIWPGIAILILWWSAFFPYHLQFESRVTGARIMEEGQTPLLTYLLFYAHLILPVFVFIVWFTIFPDGKMHGSAKRYREMGRKRKALLVLLPLAGLAAGWSMAQSQFQVESFTAVLRIAILTAGVGFIIALAISKGSGPWRRLAVPVLMFFAIGMMASYTNHSLPLELGPDCIITKTAHVLGFLDRDTIQLRDRTIGGPEEIRNGAKGFDAQTPALIAPFLCLTVLLFLRRNQLPQRRYALFIAFIALSISTGTELIYVVEPGWGPPSHRLNDIFKFFLIVWDLLAVVAACAACWVWRAWRLPAASPSQRLLRRGVRWGFAASFLMILLLCMSFTAGGPFTVMHANGARCAKEPIPTLDGSAYLPFSPQYGPDDYRIINWLNWYTKGSRPTILEFSQDRGYSELSRVSVFTGLPAVIGWPHHIGERGNEDQKAPRVFDVQTLYTTKDQSVFQDLIAKYNIRYLIWGSYEERMAQANGFTSPIPRWKKWGHLLDLIYCNGEAWIFEVPPQRTNLNASRGMNVTAEAPAPEINLPPGQQPPEPGTSIHIGGFGQLNGRFNQPRGIAVDSQDHIFVADTYNNRIQVFRLSDGAFLWKLGEEGAGEGQFKEPRDVEIDAEGNIYVCDTWNNRIQVFDPNGVFLRIITDQFFGPRAMFLDRQRKLLFVADTGAHRIGIYTLEGRQVAVLGRPDRQPGGGPGELAEPRGVAVDKDGNIYVSDHINIRIVKFNARGEFVTAWPMPFSQREEVEPRLSIGPDNRVYMSDAVNNRIVVFEPNGTIVGAIENESYENERLGACGDLAWTEKNVLLATDLTRNRVRPIYLPGLSQE